MGDAGLAELLAALRELEPEAPSFGIEVRLPGEICWEDALRTLVVIGLREPAWILLERPKEGIDAGILLDGEPVEPGAGPLPGPGVAPLPLDVKWGSEGR